MKNVEGLRKILSIFLTVLLEAIVVFLVFVTCDLIFEEDAWRNVVTIISTALSLITFFIWRPNGMDLAWKNPAVFNNNVIYNNRAKHIIDKQLFPQLKEFCKIQNEEYCKELIMEKLSRKQVNYNELLDYRQLVSDYAVLSAKTEPLTDEEKKSVESYNNFLLRHTKAQMRVIRRWQNRKPIFLKLKPKDLTRGHKSSEAIKPRNKEGLVSAVSVITKTAWGFLYGIFISAMLLTKKEVGIQDVIRVLIWTFTIISNVFSSIFNGYRAITIYRNDYITDKNDKCAEFFQFCNINTVDVDNSVSSVLKPITKS